MRTSSSFTDFFVHHPVFAWVVNIVIVLLGLTAFMQLSTRQYPETEGTLITVRTVMDGSSRMLENQITNPLEDVFSSLSGLDLENMESETQKGESKIRLRFKNRSLDDAAADVRDKISLAKLPDHIDTPIVTKGDADGNSVMELALTGQGIDMTELHYVAEKTIKSALESVGGVATVEVSGGSNFRMDVVLDPMKMKGYEITAADVTRALRTHNFQKVAGAIKEEEREFNLTTKSCLKTPQQFKDILIGKNERGNERRLVMLGDISRISICPEEERVQVKFNGKPAVSLTLRPQSNANPIEISKSVKARLEALKTALPEGVQVHIAIDKAEFIKDSVNQVYHAIFEAIILVLLVILVFLRSFKASLIPLITIPIALIGTFFIMYILGFTINVLSLLALVLAIGLVVDDAIVVLENIYRYMEEGKTPLESALLGAREIRFSVIAMTLTLAAVYAPIAMVSGVVGKVFKEFALTLAGAVLLSGFTALTLSPPMCARLLKNSGHPGDHAGASSPLVQNIVTRFFHLLSHKIDAGLSWLDKWYTVSVKRSFSWKGPILIGSIIFSISCMAVSWYHLKKEVSPAIDEGILNIRLPYIASKNLNYMTRRSGPLEKLLKEHPALSNRLVTLQTIQDSFVQSQLKPWHERKVACQDLLRPLSSQLQDIQGIEGYPFCPSESIISSRSPQYPLSFKILTTRSAEELQKLGRSIRGMLKKFPAIQDVDINEIVAVSEYNIEFKNKERINRLGIEPEEVGDILQTCIRGVNVGRFEKNERSYPVHVGIERKYLDSLDAIQSFLFARGRDDNNASIMVPLKEILSFQYAPGEPVIEHTMKKKSYNIRASLRPGYSLADSYLEFRKIVDDVLPAEYEIYPAGELKRYFDEQGTIGMIFALATMFIFLVMAAQFESVRDPLIIIFSVPLAIGGALISLFMLKSGSLNIYSQIGLITLIGLITKHGILLVDFANQRKQAGESIENAMLGACQLRLRPILMTTFAMVLGALPLAFATGSGAEARQQIGVVIAGGMTLGTLFTLFVVPVVYTMMTRRMDPKEVKNS